MSSEYIVYDLIFLDILPESIVVQPNIFYHIPITQNSGKLYHFLYFIGFLAVFFKIWNCDDKLSFVTIKI